MARRSLSRGASEHTTRPHAPRLLIRLLPSSRPARSSRIEKVLAGRRGGALPPSDRLPPCMPLHFTDHAIRPWITRRSSGKDFSGTVL